MGTGNEYLSPAYRTPFYCDTMLASRAIRR
jgi:hypothetical protein